MTFSNNAGVGVLRGAGIVQNAFVVRDLKAACLRWHQIYGIGPFLVMRHIRFAEVWYQNLPAELDISAAFVQSGDLNIELVEQHSTGRSVFRDIGDDGDDGFHHVAIFSDDYFSDKRALMAAGHNYVGELVGAGGNRIGFADTRTAMGHLVEIYEDNAGVRGLYDAVRTASATWNGDDLLRFL